MGITVIISANNGTSERTPFSPIQDIIPIADKIDAVCTSCGADAQFTFYKPGKKDTDIVVGEDEYTALCRKCWVLKTKMKNREFSSFDELIKEKATL